MLPKGFMPLKGADKFLHILVTGMEVLEWMRTNEPLMQVSGIWGRLCANVDTGAEKPPSLVTGSQ